MPQSLTRLPKTADIKMDNWDITIRNHKMVNTVGMFPKIMSIIDDLKFNVQTLYQLEVHGISFEMVIENCVDGLENNVGVLADYIWGDNCRNSDWIATIGDSSWDQVLVFSKSVAGRNIAEQFIEKIRSCDDWQQLCEEMRLTSRFSRDMRQKILKEWEQCRRV